MLTQEQIKDLATASKLVIDNVMKWRKMSVKKMYLIGSYANGTPKPDSDVDLLAEMEGGIYPTWGQMQTINKLLPPGVHVIYGTRRAQESMGKPYKEIF